MDPFALQLEIRNALALADELSRYEHALGDDEVTGHLAAMRTALSELEREVGRLREGDDELRRRLDADAAEAIGRALVALDARVSAVPARLRGSLDELVMSAERVCFAVGNPHERPPSKAVLGGLPLARLGSQDAHAHVDYAASGACLLAAALAKTGGARTVASTLAIAGLAVQVSSDQRLSPVRRIPIEAHERVDYAWGLSAALAPFALGYARRDPLASALQVIAGLGTVLVSAVTDYRAERGLSWPRRSRGGPLARYANGSPFGGPLPAEPPRPLEGLSSAPSTFRPDDVSGTELPPDTERGYP